MTDADTIAAFLAKIIADPAADGPRLTFADWCEEHGQGERAELIRAQVEIAKITSELQSGEDCEAGFCVSCDDRRKLRHRAYELLTQHEAEWVRRELGMELLIRNADGSAHYLDSRGWDQTKHPIKFMWHRGFISQAECQLETWRGRTCDRCEGNGKRMGLGDEPPRAKCHVCLGIGRVGGIGPQLVRRAPIEAVVVTDRRPADRSGFNERWYWFRTHPTTRNSTDESHLPHDVFKRMDGTTDTTIGMPYPSADAANAALSTALLVEARETPLTDVKEKVYS